MIDIIKGFLFPRGRGCPLCAAPGSDSLICARCLQNWAALARNLAICPICGRFGRELAGSGLCPECSMTPPPFRMARGVAPYDGPVREALHRFKYYGERELAGPLGEVMAALAADLFPLRSLSAVIPVPLHPSRARSRRYDQAALLAESVSGYLRLPPVLTGLVRVRNTPSQTTLSREQRLSNLKGAFAASGEVKELEGKEVLLVDDVFTTGATSAECSRVLLEQGIKGVYVLTLATAMLRCVAEGITPGQSG